MDSLRSNVPIRLDPALQAENRQSASEYQFRHEDELRALDASVTNFNQQIGQLEARIQLLHRRKTALGRMPGDLGIAFVALGLLMVGGLILPLYFLGSPSNAAESWGKWVVVVWFFVGIMLVFGYLVYLLKPAGLRLHSPKDSSPRTE